MTRREMNLAVFRGEPLPHVFFQPRFEPWYEYQKDRGGLPEEVRGMGLPEVYDHVDASMRTVHYYTGQPNPVETTWAGDVKISVNEGAGEKEVSYDTPHGTLSEKHRFTSDKTWRMVEFPAKKAEDLKALTWLMQRRRLNFNPAKYRQGKKYIGERGEGHFWVPKSPYFALAQQFMRYEDFVFAMFDAPDLLSDAMKAIDESYDQLYEQLCGSDLVNILNFGENIAMAYLSTEYFEEYVLPWYHKRSGQLRKAGVFTHIHIDGNFKPLLPYLKDMPFDGLEALTPEPQGDVTIDEMYENMGDKILLDGIPAVLFLRHHPMEDLEACVEKLVDLFHPRLILGISDELPEGGDEEAFRRLKWVAEYCRTHGGTVH